MMVPSIRPAATTHSNAAAPVAGSSSSNSGNSNHSTAKSKKSNSGSLAQPLAARGSPAASKPLSQKKRQTSAKTAARKTAMSNKLSSASPASTASSTPGKMVELSPGHELSLQRTTKKPGEGAVTKRTLQNRKAQREFRKRREARVRELEERCRRYDQMGIEANAELQRFARNLKEENEAFRNFIVRIGCGNAIPSLLDSIGSMQGPSGDHQPMGPQQLLPPQQQQQQQQSQQHHEQQQPIFGGLFGGTVTGGTFGGEAQPNFYIEPPNVTANDKQFSSGFQLQPPLLEDGNKRRSSSARDKKDSESSESPSKKKNVGTDGPLLSLNMKQRQDSQQQQQEQPMFAPDSNNVSQNQAFNRPPFLSPGGTGLSALLASQSQSTPTNGQNGAGAGVGGTAMLFGNGNGSGQSTNGNSNGNNTFAPMPIPQRSQQNAALLNPNPIPFAFNLSSNDITAQPPPSSWWDQMGGGSDNIELDEKAQAFATAQSTGGNSAQSPFDLSTFLNGGMTPGGGFQLGNPMDMAAPGSNNNNTNANAGDTAHMRTFVDLIERKVAEREARTVASLGFQPPSQDPAHRKPITSMEPMRSSPAVRMTRSLTPSGVYSRLAQHPAFLSTNARELEELVDALGPVGTPENSNGNKDDQSANPNFLASTPQSTSSPLQSRSPSSLSHGSSGVGAGKTDAEPASASSSGSDSGSGPKRKGVHVDEGAIGKLLGLLDQKRGSVDSSSSRSQWP